MKILYFMWVRMRACRQTSIWMRHLYCGGVMVDLWVIKFWNIKLNNLNDEKIVLPTKQTQLRPLIGSHDFEI